MTKRITLALAPAVGLLTALAPPALAENGSGSAPAGGAAIGQVIGASAAAGVGTGALVAVIAGDPPGPLTVLDRLAGFPERVSGIPGFASLPAAILGSTLIIAVFG